MKDDRIQHGLPGVHEPTPEEMERAMRNANRERARVFGELARAVGAWLERVNHAHTGVPVHVPDMRASARSA
jgi:hypothetical protein